MMAWSVLFRKEWLEFRRSYKWIWIPLVFLLLGISQPVSSYLLPDLIKSAGNLPEGAVMEIPVPKPMEVMAGTLSNFSSIGLLVVVLAAMSAVAGERNRGVTGMIMAKPVSPLTYITSKWLAYQLLSLGSLLLGYLGAWFYTDMLIGSVDAGRAMEGFGLYGLWFAFYLTVTLLLSTLLRSAPAAAAVTLVSAAVLSILSGTLSSWMTWSPGRLTIHAREFLLNGNGTDHFPLCISVSVVLLVLILAFTVFAFRRMALTASD
ncbi:ABC transporter permease [Gorillibacterium timonense]|uniref:ABC transporter permease n=1 Tax=Gorillibacterium timonense TaxID=1689269 RepID=UPI00071D23D3|nr:ABC transporter permease subunit [Gorillibacterium timonense]